MDIIQVVDTLLVGGLSEKVGVGKCILYAICTFNQVLLKGGVYVIVLPL